MQQPVQASSFPATTSHGTIRLYEAGTETALGLWSRQPRSIVFSSERNTTPSGAWRGATQPL